MEEENSKGITRRSLLQGILGAFGLSALSPLEAFARKGQLPADIEYVKYKNQLVLRIIARRGDSYESISTIFSGTENNAGKIKYFNESKPLHPKDLVYIPVNIVINPIRIILDERNFVVYEIAEEGEEGISNLWTLIKNFMDEQRFNFDQRKSIILAINPGIPTNNILQNGQQILVPYSLVKREIDVSRKKRKKIETPLPKPKTGSKKQNPLRTDISVLRKNIDPEDRFGASRLRSNGRKHWASTHQGIDLDCPLKTRLYPVERGVLLYSGWEKHRRPRYWRNGIVVEYQISNGISITYCHLSSINKELKLGQQIDLNTVLGRSGDTGNAKGREPHVHVGAKKNGNVTDPTPYVFIDS